MRLTAKNFAYVEAISLSPCRARRMIRPGARRKKDDCIGLDLYVSGFLRLHRSDAVALRRALISLPCRQFPAHPDTISLLEHLIREVSSELLLTIDAAHAEARSSLNVRLRRCLQLIHDRVDEPLTISHLADFCRISVPRFKVWFRNATGIPPRE